MAKHLRNIVGKDTDLKGVKSSKVEKMDLSDYEKSEDGRKFAAKHAIEKHADRVGNGEEDYKGNTKQAVEKRHGNTTAEKSKKVYESSCNMTEAGKMCEVHGDDECPSYKSKGKKKLLIDKKNLEERKMTSYEKEKEQELKTKYDPSGMKASMQKQYGAEKGKNIYFATIRKKAMSKKKE